MSGAPRARAWLPDWDQVALERRIGDPGASRTLDIVLSRAGAVVGAAEVFHTHGVDDAKAQALAALGVPWVEVRADAALLAPETAWTLDAPLPAYRVGPDPLWRCPQHAAAAAEIWEAARHTAVVRAAKAFDLRLPDGTHRRHVYRVVEYRTDGLRISAMSISRFARRRSRGSPDVDQPVRAKPISRSVRCRSGPGG